MKMVTDFPFAVEETAHLPIPLADGTILSARIWRPVTEEPVPAILEYLPYRKRDGTAERDALTHPYMAGHGYACVRVDMRGCGDSEGLFEDEYSEQELTDGVAIVEWLAAQSWCSGSVGMMGISWGGFNGLQIAALAPEPLKAVVSICSTVDRYADDIHYKGGVMLGENPAWAATVLGWFALPPDPDVMGDGWRDHWLHRLENTPFLAERWVAHQTRDPYWKHGSVCESYDTITAAVLAVGGWHDGYRNTPAHLVENLSAPVKGLIGPWNHKYPHFAVPGPQIDFLGEMLRWWDHWLKGIDTGANELPDMRRWLMDSVPPEVRYLERPGRWIGDDRTQVSAPKETWHLRRQGLSQEAGVAERMVLPELSCGLAAGEYFPFGFGPGELPDDQRHDDAVSCFFDSPVLDQEKAVVGAPAVSLLVKSDKPKAQIAVRLCDVHPNGASTLITHGFLNLRHRNGHEVPEELPCDEFVEAEVVLDQCAYRVPAGHILRISLSSSYWPFVWPEPELATLELQEGTLKLPVRLRTEESFVEFDPPKSAPARETRRVRDGSESKRQIRDVGSRSITLEIEGDDGAIEDVETGLISGLKHQEQFYIQEDDPNSARSDFRWQREVSRGDWGVKTDAQITMETDGESYLLTAKLNVCENSEEIFSKTWRATVPRL